MALGEQRDVETEVLGFRRDEADGGLPVLGVVPGDETRHLCVSLLDRREGALGEGGAVLQCAEEGLGEGVVVRDAGRLKDWATPSHCSVASIVAPVMGNGPANDEP